MLPKIHRVNKEKDFKNINRMSKPIYSRNFIFKIIKNNLLVTRFAFVVSNKVDKRAVSRNLLRRRLSSVAQNLISELEKGYDIVVIAKSGGDFRDFDAIKDDVVYALKKADVLR